MTSRPLLPLAAMFLASCVVTGNPREGGLFGWSESMARDRVADRRAQIAKADAQLARARRHGEIEKGRLQAVTREESAAARRRDQADEEIRVRETAIRAKAAQLETDSPTPATASRAHRLRVAVDSVARDFRLSKPERVREMRRLELEIDAAQAELHR